MHIINWFVSWIVLYWLDIVIISALVALILIWVKKGNKQKLLELAKYAVTQAERLYKSETGQLKKNEAITWLQEHSVLARILLTDAEVDVLIEKAWAWLDEELNQAEQDALLK